MDNSASPYVRNFFGETPLDLTTQQNSIFRKQDYSPKDSSRVTEQNLGIPSGNTSLNKTFESTHSNYFPTKVLDEELEPVDLNTSSRTDEQSQFFSSVSTSRKRRRSLVVGKGVESEKIETSKGKYPPARLPALTLRNKRGKKNAFSQELGSSYLDQKNLGGGKKNSKSLDAALTSVMTLPPFPGLNSRKKLMASSGTTTTMTTNLGTTMNTNMNTNGSQAITTNSGTGFTIDSSPRKLSTNSYPLAPSNSMMETFSSGEGVMSHSASSCTTSDGTLPLPGIR
eukprot:TRINITY_DN11724_c0_g1_i2.p1 TRINITY_DN11724_c0_g1~~TRINITY_DN11724_c0_g1_i2.p1  ORF type:complete len:283 (+),score=66.02 TRINITY_DN11724_c0_g1_i2:329-1177(+)